jgi:DNA-binding MarR family transcriptional regulator
MSPIITPFLLDRLSTLLNQSLRDYALQYGLLPIHVQVLAYLAQANQYSDIPIAIAEYFGITRGTVSQTVNLLESRGLLNKKTDPRHGKRVHLVLTPKGKSIVDSGWSKALSAGISHEPLNVKEVNAMLLSLLKRLQRLNGQKAFGICHECMHFLKNEKANSCGLTGEILTTDQTLRICREWSVQDNGPFTD